MTYSDWVNWDFSKLIIGQTTFPNIPQRNNSLVTCSISGMRNHLPRHFSYLLLMPGYMCCQQGCSCCQREESLQVCQPWPSIPLYASGHRIIGFLWPKDIGLCEGTREESKEENGRRKSDQSSFWTPLCGNTEGYCGSHHGHLFAILTFIFDLTISTIIFTFILFSFLLQL